MSYKITITCLKYSSVLLFMLMFQPGWSQSGKNKVKEVGTEEYSELDALVLKNQKLLGNDVVAMVWKDTLVYKRELGSFNSKTVAPVASASKWLTAALVMKMVEEGKISLDDKVSDYITVYETYGKGFITIRHCLSHFTGIEAGKKIFKKKKFNTLQEEVESFAKNEIRTNPGTDFHYDEMGLNIAGRIMEIVGKKRFDLLIRQKLFIPLGMRKTTFSTLDGSALDPSGGARSTADDYMQFLKMMLNNGKHNGQQFLSEESMSELKKIQTTPEQIIHAPESAHGFSYALGSWAIEEKDGNATVLASPGFYGTWPMVSWSKGYAFLIFPKTTLKDAKKDVYMEMKEAID